jgi:hypothetical protein
MNNKQVLVPNTKDYYVGNNGEVRRKNPKVKKNKKYVKEVAVKPVISKLTKRIMAQGFKKDKKE